MENSIENQIQPLSEVFLNQERGASVKTLHYS